jgi:uncharacterized protein
MKEYKFLENYVVKEYWKMELGQSATDTLTLTPEIVADLTEIQVLGEVKVNLIWEKAEKFLMLNLSVLGELNQECSKCLKVTLHKIENESEFEFSQSVEDGDDRIKITSDLAVNLIQPIIDTFVTAIDQFPVCKKSCLGLCPTCGVNLNDNPDHKKANTNHFISEEVDNKPKIV